MLITMLYTARGSQDGFKVERFEAGQTYDLAEVLACHFLRWNMAVRARN